jgi:hypothetical protein
MEEFETHRGYHIGRTFIAVDRNNICNVRNCQRIKTVAFNFEQGHLTTFPSPVESLLEILLFSPLNHLHPRVWRVEGGHSRERSVRLQPRPLDGADAVAVSEATDPSCGAACAARLKLNRRIV